MTQNVEKKRPCRKTQQMKQRLKDSVLSARHLPKKQKKATEKRTEETSISEAGPSGACSAGDTCAEESACQTTTIWGSSAGMPIEHYSHHCCGPSLLGNAFAQPSTQLESGSERGDNAPNRPPSPQGPPPHTSRHIASRMAPIVGNSSTWTISCGRVRAVWPSSRLRSIPAGPPPPRRNGAVGVGTAPQGSR